MTSQLKTILKITRKIHGTWKILKISLGFSEFLIVKANFHKIQGK